MGEDTKQDEAFEPIRLLVDYALIGKNCSIFVYGATGSGKSYTMTGGEWKHFGIVQQTIIYARIRANAIPPLKNFKVSCTMIQLYKSQMTDLFRSEEDPILALNLVYHNNMITIQNAIQVQPEDFLEPGGDERLIKVVNRGLDNRMMRSTDINEASSRSHLLFSIVFEHTDPKSGRKIVGKMTFVDLAGSERVARIVLTEFLYEEAIFINESLKYLAYVIRRLVDGRAPELINYEYHPLTCLVRDTLGGTSKTLVLVNISPSIYDMEATMDTLRFAEKTGRVKTQSGLITVNEEQLNAWDTFKANEEFKSRQFAISVDYQNTAAFESLIL